MAVKTIALFGGTGKSGQEFLPKALAAGYRVQAMARTPEKITLTNQNLILIPGDVLSATDVEQTLAGADVVVSLFGHVKGSPHWLQTEGTKHILKGMEAHGVKKIISLSGGGLPFAQDQPKFPDKMIRFIMRVAVPHILNDAIRHAEVLAASSADWIIVRAPRLTDAPGKGRYRVGWVGVNASTAISRADLADFILSQIESDEFLRQMPFVSW